MKTKLGFFTLVLLVSFCTNSMADEWSGGLIQDGDNYDSIDMWGGTTIMTGGYVGSFYCNDGRLLFSDGEINYYSGFTGGIFEMSGGICNSISLACDAEAYLSGGQINGTISGYEGIICQITGYSLTPNLIIDENSGFQSGTISGYWQDGTAFNLKISFDNSSQYYL